MLSELVQRLVAAMRESDEWATPADLLRSLEDQGLRLITPAEAAVLDACAAMVPVANRFSTGDGMSLHDSTEILRAELARRQQQPEQGRELAREWCGGCCANTDSVCARCGAAREKGRKP